MSRGRATGMFTRVSLAGTSLVILSDRVSIWNNGHIIMRWQKPSEWFMSDIYSTGAFDHFPRCAFGVGGLDFFLCGRTTNSRGGCSYWLFSYVITVTQRITCYTWYRRGVFFIQSRFNQSKTEISRDLFEYFTQSIVSNRYQGLSIFASMGKHKKKQWQMVEPCSCPPVKNTHCSAWRKKRYLRVQRP